MVEAIACCSIVGVKQLLSFFQECYLCFSEQNFKFIYISYFEQHFKGMRVYLDFYKFILFYSFILAIRRLKSLENSK